MSTNFDLPVPGFQRRPIRWLRSLLEIQFVAQVLTLTSGTVAAQGLLVVFAPVLSRLFDPTDFACYAMFAVVANPLMAIASGKYEFALMLPKHDGEAIHVALAAFAVSVLLAAVTLPFIALFGSLAAQLGHWTSPHTWIILVPLSVLIQAWYAVSAKWMTRTKRFARIAQAELCATISTLAIQVGGGMLLVHPSGDLLIVGQLTGRLTALCVLYLSFRRDLSLYRDDLSVSRALQSARRYWRFPAITAPAELMVKFTFELPKLMIGAFFGPIVLGCYALSMRVLGTPLTLVGQSVAHVFFPRIAETRANPQQSRRLLLRAGAALLALIVVPMIIIFVGGEWLFATVFGEQWRLAGYYSQLLIPLVAAQFVVQPIALSMQAFEKQHVALIWQACVLGLVVAAFWIGHLFDSVSTALLLYSVAACGMYCIFFVLCLAGAKSQMVSRGETKDANGDLVGSVSGGV